MDIVTRFPRPVREIENVFITLSDGCRLAARIWLPEDAEADPVPAILEYLPYRKREGTSERDALTHPYFAGHGYACIRVDMRGSGESDGVLEDEYLKQEQDDALEVLAWIAAQPWCTGAVGMIGISWGGFNGLQVAARRPPQLKAVITLCSTDDRYADDVHYMGGCLLQRQYRLGLDHVRHHDQSARPGAGRRALGAQMWLERLEKEPLLVDVWPGTSVATPIGSTGRSARISAPSPARSMPSAAGPTAIPTPSPACSPDCHVPRKGLIGPWAHNYPHFAKPGPRIGFLQECLRWWDQWLKGATPASWTSRCSGPGWRIGSTPSRSTRIGPAVGWPKPPGPVHGSIPNAGR